MNAVIESRILIGLTLGFHIIFATVGVGIPLLLLIAEWIGIRKQDPHYLLLARRWSRGFSVTVAVGVVTGTILGLQLTLLFPGFMQVAGQIISLPLFLETFAFFFEAIFLGIYLYTWDRFKKQVYHWLLLIPVVIGSSASAFFITTVNSFMNTPQGFTLKNGTITHIDPIRAMFNPATPTETTHVLSSAYMTAAFVVAAITAGAILLGHRNEYYRKALRLTLSVGFIFAVTTAIIGDISGKFLATYQPEKLAAAEWHFQTDRYADLLVGGLLDPNTHQVKGAIVLPGMLSFLADEHFDSKVMGLDQVPKDLWPPLIIHYWFDLMVGIGSFLLALSAIFLVLKKWKPQWEWNPWLLRLIVIGGPLSMLAIEFGWIFAEIGRQPWILRGYLRVSETATTSPNVGAMLILFSILYVILAAICTMVLLRIFRNSSVESELNKRGILVEGGLQGVN